MEFNINTKRKIDMVIIHCSATEAGNDYDVEHIRKWHVEGNGWSDVGYHFVVKLDGTIQEGRPIWRAGAHCKGKNMRSIGICYIGGVRDGAPKDTRTEAQKVALVKLLKYIRKQYSGVGIYGHRDFANKNCPSFDATAEYFGLQGDS